MVRGRPKPGVVAVRGESNAPCARTTEPNLTSSPCPQRTKSTDTEQQTPGLSVDGLEDFLDTSEDEELPDVQKRYCQNLASSA